MDMLDILLKMVGRTRQVMDHSHQSCFERQPRGVAHRIFRPDVDPFPAGAERHVTPKSLRAKSRGDVSTWVARPKPPAMSVAELAWASTTHHALRRASNRLSSPKSGTCHPEFEWPHTV